MYRIAIFADLHANLPALEAILKKIDKLGADEIISLGDNIAIGPHPAECVDLLMGRNIQSVMGNHEEYFLKGLDKGRPEYIGEGEQTHQLWTHQRLNGDHWSYLSSLPYSMERKAEELTIGFSHSPYKKSSRFTDFTNLWNTSPADIEESFSNSGCDIICFGHSHVPLDTTLHRRFINPGSVSCHKWSYARFSLLEIEGARLTATHCQVPYDKEGLMPDFERLQVPERENIVKIFFHRDQNGET